MSSRRANVDGKPPIGPLGERRRWSPRAATKTQARAPTDPRQPTATVCRMARGPPGGFRHREGVGLNPLDAVVHDLCRYIDAHADEKLSLADLATRAGYSPAHLQKAFKALVGSSPREYQKAVRMRHLKEVLRGGEPPLPATFRAGFGSPSRVYEDLPRTLGMTPGQYQKGGATITIHWATTTTPLGLMTMGATERGLCFLELGDNEAELVDKLKAEFPRATVQPMPEESAPLFAQWQAALGDFFDGKAPLSALPVDLVGTAFQIAVWRFLQSIPPGTVASYAEVAEAIGHPKAVRAVGTACGRNRIAILVPCHRVIRGDGQLGGYRWGLERKIRLLEIERGRP